MNKEEIMTNLDFLKITKETEIEFKNIAETLFNKFAIKTKYGIYRLMEIEFYWKSPTHNDESTYKRKYVNPKQGEWFFHYSGVDIALRNDDINGYGGILIRKIQNIENKNDKYNGPMVCAMKLFSGVSAVSKDSFPIIVKYDFPKEEVSNTERVNLGDNAKKGGYDKRKYRFKIS
jgi:hypothetical protein